MTRVLRGLFVWFLCSCVYRKCERVHCVYIMCIHPGSWESQYPNSCVGPSMQVLVRNLSLKLLWETPHPVSCGDPSPRLLWGTPHPGFCGEPLTQVSIGNPLPSPLWGAPHPVPCGEPLTQASVGEPSPRFLGRSSHLCSWEVPSKLSGSQATLDWSDFLSLCWCPIQSERTFVYILLGEVWGLGLGGHPESSLSPGCCSKVRALPVRKELRWL